MLEAALIFLPLMVLFFGLLDFSFVFFLRGLFQMAVREGARYAITYSTTYGDASCGTQTDCVKKVVQAHTLGFLTGTGGANYIQVNYYTPDNLSAPVTSGMLPLTLLNGNVVRYVNQTGNVVEVRVNAYPWNWMAPLPGFMPGRGITVSATAADVLQGYPVGQFTPPAP